MPTLPGARRAGVRGIAVLAAMLVAGCLQADGSAASSQATSTDYAPAAFDETTGGIEGLVTDDALAPIDGADVQLVDGPSTSTAAGGRFSFSRLAPGTYVMNVLAPGYEATAQRIEVLAGTAASAQVTLTPLPVKEPYSVTGIKAGEVMCSAYVRVANGLPGAIGACVLVDNRFMTHWEYRDLTGLSGLWLETSWRSNQVAGNGLELYVPFGVGSTMYTYLARNLIGPSPIRHNVTEEAVTEFLASRKVSDGLEACKDKGCALEIWHYVYGHLLGPSSQVDAGLLLQQRYDDYVTTFFHGEFPAEFTALPDT